MATFAVLDGQDVLNIVLADSKAIAEEATGKTCVAFTTEPAEPGGTYVEGVFLKKKPYPSWVLGLNGDWKAPTEMPVDDNAYEWDEETGSWVLFS